MAITIELFHYSLVSVFVALFIVFVYNKCTYWQRRGVLQRCPTPFLGNYGSVLLMKKSIADVDMKLYQEFSKQKFFGSYFFSSNVLVVRDPELIKHIVTQDHLFFLMHAYTIQKEPFATNLFDNSGDEWKVWRQHLAPLFTTAKIKSIFGKMVECGQELESYVKTLKKDNIDIRRVMTNFTIEVVGSCTFGLQMNSMNEESNMFRVAAKKVFEPSIAFAAKQLLRTLTPSVFYALKLTQINKDLVGFFVALVNLVVDTRRKKITRNRNDFVDLLSEMKAAGFIEGPSLYRHRENNEKIRVKVDEFSMAAQAFMIFSAGFETTSSTISFALYELAKNRLTQIKLREEISNKLKATGGEITFDLLSNFEYLDLIVDETLRMYPVLGNITRKCTTEYTLPGTGLTLEKGVVIHFPVRALHYDPQYYPEPEIFNPDRFRPEVKASRPRYVYMPFGEGPRICIGMRYGRMQTKLGIMTIIKNYDVSLADGMPRTIDYDPISLVTAHKDGLYLKFVEINIQ